jgi:PAS domain S-box-containing protein
MHNEIYKTILLVEDEAIIAITQKTTLEKYGYKVITANSGEMAIEKLDQASSIDLILMDIDLGNGIDGTETATMILSRMDIPIVFLSSHTEPRVVEKTEKITSYGYVVKNSGITVLDASIKMAFKLFDAKEKVYAHSARNEAILQSLPDQMFILDKEGKYLEVYTSEDIQHPIPSSEIIGKTLNDFLAKDEAEKLLSKFNICFESRKLQVCEVEMMVNGNKKLYEARLSRLSKDNILAIFRNITDRRQAEYDIKVKNEELEALNEELSAVIEEMEATNEELGATNEELMQSRNDLIEYADALNESERKYRDIYNNAIEGIFQTTPEGKLTGSNPSYAATFGFESPESIMNEVNNIGHQLYANPEDRELLKKLLADHTRVVNFEVEARTCKGEKIYVSINASGQKDENGSLKNITGTIIDITEKKLAEEVLRESEKRFDMLAAQNRTIIWEVDEKGLYTYVSNVAEQVLGYKPEELIGKKYFYDLCPESERDALKTGIFSAFEQREQFTAMLNPMTSRDGRIIQVSTNAIPIIDKNQNLLGYHGSDMDVTDSMTTLNSLRESESRYRALIENTGQAIVVAQDGIIQYANPVTSVLTGYSQEEIYSKPFLEFIHPDDRNMVIKHYQKRFTGDSGNKSVYKFRALTKDGSVKWSEINAVRIDWNGRPATLNFLTDVTVQMMAENKLRESENKYRKIFENTQDIFYQTDMNGIIIEISPSIERYTGFTREDLIGTKVDSVYYEPRDRAELLKIISAYGEVIDYELRLKAKDDRLIITSTSSHILFDSDGNPIGIEGSLRDITKRKQMESDLIKSEQLHRLLTDNTSDVIWTMDFSGHFTYVSPSVEKLRGYTVDEVMQQSLNESLMPESAAIAKASFKNAIESIQAGQPVPEFRGELKQPCKDGSSVWTESTISAMHNISGEIIGIVGVTRDITERKLAEDKIRSLLKEKELILKEVHHRIKNNMNTLNGILSLQAETLNEPSAVAALQDAGTRIQSMMLLYDKLYLSDNFNGIPVLNYLPFLIDEILANFPNRKIVKIEKEIGDFILDSKILQPFSLIINELLTNIMKHAFKGRSDGLIKISASLTGKTIIIIIADNGVGIPELIDLKKATGFGMQLVSMLADQIGGNIMIERSNGTKFIIEFTAK